MNNIKNSFINLGILCLLPFFIESRSISFSSKTLNEDSQEIEMHVTLDPDEWLYKDYITFSVDNPNITLSPFKSSQNATNRYDPTFKKTKKIFENEIKVFITATKKPDFNGDVYLHVNTLSNKYGAEENLFLLTFKQNQENNTEQQHINLQIQENNPEQKKIVKKIEEHKEEPFSLSAYISSLVKTIHSPFIRLLLVFLLGVLLSLTPCIYPMVPITIGILQAQGSKSILYNFLLAVIYTCGMATTFALFGLLASCTGPLCGQLLMEPLFIIGLVIVLGYLGFSMLGLYDVYVPKFFKSSAQPTLRGSLFSTFIFGAASGTIASPCVSPGLVLLLSIVATLGNKILGFLLLFAFGIGLSTPLLIVGTFSSSLNLLPKAGLWMVEIKKIFGFMIFGMCFYYISYIVSFTILLWFIGIFTASIGIYYLHSSQTMISPTWKKITLFLGILLITCAVIIFFQAYRAMTYGNRDTYDPHKNLWHTDYENTLNQARKEDKKLFIDFWATFCPVCLAINKTTFTKPKIIAALQTFVMLKVDGTYNSNKPYDRLKDKFGIKGFPTFLLIDPTTETIIKEWGGEIYDMADETLIKEFENLS
jgi:thioredoxin:protein disulfide reductase